MTLASWEAVGPGGSEIDVCACVNRGSPEDLPVPQARLVTDVTIRRMLILLPAIEAVKPFQLLAGLEKSFTKLGHIDHVHLSQNGNSAQVTVERRKALFACRHRDENRVTLGHLEALDQRPDI